VNANIDLPAGADGIKLEVLNDKGQTVRTQIFGAQMPGSASLSWDGLDDAGNNLPDGNYRFVATVTSAGKTTQPTVNTLATVRSVSSAGTADNTWLLEVDGGKTVSMNDVKRIGY
jgi:flagellar basal-body rod modification protein FlgD